MVKAKNKNLIKNRVMSGMTMRDLSDQSGVPIATISRAENGKSISVRTAHKLCNVFNLGFDDLFIIQDNNQNQ